MEVHDHPFDAAEARCLERQLEGEKLANEILLGMYAETIDLMMRVGALLCLPGDRIDGFPDHYIVNGDHSGCNCYVPNVCNNCNGTGTLEDFEGIRPCSKCSGAGIVP